MANSKRSFASNHTQFIKIIASYYKYCYVHVSGHLELHAGKYLVEGRTPILGLVLRISLIN